MTTIASSVLFPYPNQVQEDEALFYICFVRPFFRQNPVLPPRARSKEQAKAKVVAAAVVAHNTKRLTDEFLHEASQLPHDEHGCIRDVAGCITDEVYVAECMQRLAAQCELDKSSAKYDSFVLAPPDTPRDLLRGIGSGQPQHQDHGGLVVQAAESVVERLLGGAYIDVDNRERYIHAHALLFPGIFRAFTEVLDYLSSHQFSSNERYAHVTNSLELATSEFEI